jgi:phospholipase/carboxylesterase
MTTLMLGPLRVHARGGEDHRGGGDGPAILLCHGFGAPGDDLVGLSRVIDAGRSVRWFFPEAPLEVNVGPGAQGRAWWPIDMDRLVTLLMRGDQDGALRMLDEVPEGLPAAREALGACLEALERDRGVRRDQLIVGGFSQGSMLTTDLVATQQEPFAGLVALSGTLIGSAGWEEGLGKVGSRLSVLLAHGRRDPLLPFGRAERLREVLLAAGAHVTWVPHAGAHEIPQAVCDALGTFARGRLGGLGA